MRFLVGLAALLFIISPPAVVAADGTDTLKGNITKDGQTRVTRPLSDPQSGSVDATQSAAPFANPNTKLNARLDAGAFDLNAQRGRVPLGGSWTNLNGWIHDAPPDVSAADIHADMDRFFATGAAQHNFVRPQLAPHQFRSGVFVRMGMCGSWDAQGDGRRRWQILNQELHAAGPLQMLWQQWQRDVTATLQNEFQGLKGMSGTAALHVAVRRDGFIESITEYRGPEQPTHDMPRSIEMNVELSNTVLRLGSLPAFPAGSQAPEAHILIFAAN